MEGVDRLGHIYQKSKLSIATFSSVHLWPATTAGMQAVDVLASCRGAVLRRKLLPCLHRPFHRSSTSYRGYRSSALHQQQSQRISRVPHAATAVNSGKGSDQEKHAFASALLTRDFIAKSLYNQDTGYFSTKDVINDLPGPLEFGSMLGELHYRMDVKKASWVLAA